MPTLYFNFHLDFLFTLTKQRYHSLSLKSELPSQKEIMAEKRRWLNHAKSLQRGEIKGSFYNLESKLTLFDAHQKYLHKQGYVLNESENKNLQKLQQAYKKLAKNKPTEDDSIKVVGEYAKELTDVYKKLSITTQTIKYRTNFIKEFNSAKNWEFFFFKKILLPALVNEDGIHSQELLLERAALSKLFSVKTRLADDFYHITLDSLQHEFPLTYQRFSSQIKQFKEIKAKWLGETPKAQIAIYAGYPLNQRRVDGFIAKGLIQILAELNIIENNLCEAKTSLDFDIKTLRSEIGLPKNQKFRNGIINIIKEQLKELQLKIDQERLLITTSIIERLKIFATEQHSDILLSLSNQLLKIFPDCKEYQELNSIFKKSLREEITFASLSIYLLRIEKTIKLLSNNAEHNKKIKQLHQQLVDLNLPWPRDLNHLPIASYNPKNFLETQLFKSKVIWSFVKNRIELENDLNNPIKDLQSLLNPLHYQLQTTLKLEIYKTKIIEGRKALAELNHIHTIAYPTKSTWFWPLNQIIDWYYRPHLTLKFKNMLQAAQHHINAKNIENLEQSYREKELYVFNNMLSAVKTTQKELLSDRVYHLSAEEIHKKLMQLESANIFIKKYINEHSLKPLIEVDLLSYCLELLVLGTLSESIMQRFIHILSSSKNLSENQLQGLEQFTQLIFKPQNCDKTNLKIQDALMHTFGNLAVARIQVALETKYSRLFNEWENNGCIDGSQRIQLRNLAQICQELGSNLSLIPEVYIVRFDQMIDHTHQNLVSVTDPIWKKIEIAASFIRKDIQEKVSVTNEFTNNLKNSCKAIKAICSNFVSTGNYVALNQYSKLINPIFSMENPVDFIEWHNYTKNKITLYPYIKWLGSLLANNIEKHYHELDRLCAYLKEMTRGIPSHPAVKELFVETTILATLETLFNNLCKQLTSTESYKALHKLLCFFCEYFEDADNDFFLRLKISLAKTIHNSATESQFHQILNIIPNRLKHPNISEAEKLYSQLNLTAQTQVRNAINQLLFKNSNEYVYPKFMIETAFDKLKTLSNVSLELSENLNRSCYFFWMPPTGFVFAEDMLFSISTFQNKLIRIINNLDIDQWQTMYTAIQIGKNHITVPQPIQEALLERRFNLTLFYLRAFDAKNIDNNKYDLNYYLSFFSQIPGLINSSTENFEKNKNQLKQLVKGLLYNLQGATLKFVFQQLPLDWKNDDFYQHIQHLINSEQWLLQNNLFDKNHLLTFLNEISHDHCAKENFRNNLTCLLDKHAPFEPLTTAKKVVSALEELFNDMLKLNNNNRPLSLFIFETNFSKNSHPSLYNLSSKLKSHLDELINNFLKSSISPCLANLTEALHLMSFTTLGDSRNSLILFTDSIYITFKGKEKTQQYRELINKLLSSESFQDNALTTVNLQINSMMKHYLYLVKCFKIQNADFSLLLHEKLKSDVQHISCVIQQNLQILSNQIRQSRDTINSVVILHTSHQLMLILELTKIVKHDNNTLIEIGHDALVDFMRTLEKNSELMEFIWLIPINHLEKILHYSMLFLTKVVNMYGQILLQKIECFSLNNTQQEFNDLLDRLQFFTIHSKILDSLLINEIAKSNFSTSFSNNLGEIIKGKSSAWKTKYSKLMEIVANPELSITMPLIALNSEATHSKISIEFLASSLSKCFNEQSKTQADLRPKLL